MAIKLGGGGLCARSQHAAPPAGTRRPISKASARPRRPKLRAAPPGRPRPVRRVARALPRAGAGRQGAADATVTATQPTTAIAATQTTTAITTSVSSTSFTTSFSTNPNPNQVLPVPIPRQSVLACEQALSSRTPAMAEVLIHCRALASRDDGIVDQLPWAWNPSELAKRMPRRLEPSTSRRKKSQAGLVLLLTRA